MSKWLGIRKKKSWFRCQRLGLPHKALYSISENRFIYLGRSENSQNPAFLALDRITLILGQRARAGKQSGQSTGLIEPG